MFRTRLPSTLEGQHHEARLIVLSIDEKSKQPKILIDVEKGLLPGGMLRPSVLPGDIFASKETPQACAVRMLQVQSGNVLTLSTKNVRKGRLYDEPDWQPGSMPGQSMATHIYSVVFPQPIAPSKQAPLSWVDLDAALSPTGEHGDRDLLKDPEHKVMLADFLFDHPGNAWVREQVSASHLQRMSLADQVSFRPLRLPEFEDEQPVEREDALEPSPLGALMGLVEDPRACPPTTFVRRKPGSAPRLAFSFRQGCEPNDQELSVALSAPDVDPGY